MKLEDRVLLPEEGFYKANLHCHTTISDGELTPEEIKAAYKGQGYSIVAFTDHEQYRWHKELDDENFLALAAYETELCGFETGPGCWPDLKTYHLNLFDTDPTEKQEIKAQSLRPPRRYGDMASLNEYIAAMNELGFLVCYNHPYWSLQTYEDYKDLRGLFAMEIYNYGCEHDGLYGFHPQSYDEMLRSGQKLFALATDDNHDRVPFTDPLNDSFGGFVMIAAEKLTYKSVIRALRAGRFYWSMGPELKGVSIQDGVLRVKTSPVEKIFAIQKGRDCYKQLAPRGETITDAEFPLTGKEGWLRIEVRDGKGLYAGTNAYFVEDL